MDLEEKDRGPIQGKYVEGTIEGKEN